jgi:hemolysin III
MKKGTTQESEYSFGEEVANALTHGIGAVFGIVGLVLMVLVATALDDPWRLWSAIIYGASLVLLFVASTVYHAVPGGRAKRFWQQMDHCAIYLLIAGTYTPFLMISLRDSWGYWLLAVIWSLAVFGVVFTLLWRHRFPKIALATYVLMGWLIVIAAGPLMQKVPAAGMWLLLGGGLAYTFGVVFYVWERLPYSHAIWHVFVLAGSALHFLAIYFYVMEPVHSASGLQ